MSDESMEDFLVGMSQTMVQTFYYMADGSHRTIDHATGVEEVWTPALMMSGDRKLAYKGYPGDASPESSWIKSRRWLQGETEVQAKAAIQSDINAGKIVVIEPVE